MTGFILETPRLLMRPMKTSDAAGMFEMNRSPNLLGCLGNKTPLSLAKGLAHIGDILGNTASHTILQHTGMQPDGQFTCDGLACNRYFLKNPNP